MRSAGISLCGVIYMYMGQNFRVMFDSEKPALLKELDAEIEKVCQWASAKKKKKYRLHWKKYCGIIGFRGGLIFVEFMSTSYPRINILYKLIN